MLTEWLLVDNIRDRNIGIWYNLCEPESPGANRHSSRFRSSFHLHRTFNFEDLEHRTPLSGIRASSRAASNNDDLKIIVCMELRLFPVSAVRGSGPNFNFVADGSSNGGSGTTATGVSGSTIGVAPGGSNPTATLHPAPTMNANMTVPMSADSGSGQNSVFVSYSMSNGVPVPVLMYTSALGESTSGWTLSPATGNVNKSGPSTGVIVGVSMGATAGVALILFLLWWMLRRRQIRQSQLLDASVKAEARWADSAAYPNNIVASGGVLPKRHSPNNGRDSDDTDNVNAARNSRP